MDVLKLQQILETAEGQDRLRKIIQSDTPDGYELFYNLVQNRPLPKHGKKWIEEIYGFCPPGEGIGLEAFRGSTKTTVVTNTFTAYQIGCYPKRRNLILRAADDKATESVKWLADTIETNPYWKFCFPHVVPDGEKGWSMLGFEVKDTSVDYGEFRRGLGQNPCFVGYGYTAKAYHGNHPDGLLILDDIDTETNTRSDRERAEVRDLITGTIMPMRVPHKTRTIPIGTPWREKDTLGFFRSLKTFHWLKMPVQDADGNPTWPEVFSKEVIEKLRSEMPALEFARQYLLDVTAAEGQKLKREWLHTYPGKIERSWPCVFGVDYASAADRLGRGKEKDYLAIAVGRTIPGGGLVIVDIERKQCSQGEAELLLARMYDGYHPMYIGVEDLGTGKEFYQLIARSTQLPVVPSKVQNKSKGHRFEKELGPAFQFGKIMLSDITTDGLRAFEDEWVSYDHGDHDDCLDAVWHCAKTAMAEMTNVADVAVEIKPRKKLDWSGLGMRG
jgi:phage terminase large subunit-like protein